MPATRCARGPSLGAATLAACGKTHAAFDRRSIPAEPLRFAAFCVAFRSKYTRYSSLTRLVSRAPHRPRRSRGFHHRLLAEGTGQKRRFWARHRGPREPRNRAVPIGEEARGRPGAPVFRPYRESWPASRRKAAKLPSPTAKKRGDGRERRCSHRHRAGARNPHRWRCVIPCPSSACAHPGWRDHLSLPSPRRRGRRKRHPRVAPGGAGPVTSRAGTRGRRATSSSRRPARPI